MINWNNITVQLKNDPDYQVNKTLAEAVVNNEAKAVNYYLADIGFPIMQHIERTITHHDITAEYYIFLSSPYDKEEEKATWHPVSLYRGNGCMLSSYTTKITCRHFCYQANKDRKKQNKEGELLEFVDYESLIKCDTEDTAGSNLQEKCVRKAYNQLKEKDKQVIKYLVIKNMSAKEAYPFLEHWIHARAKDGQTSEEVKKSWSVKRRQDAMALMKGHALDRLQQNYNLIRVQFK